MHLVPQFICECNSEGLDEVNAYLPKLSQTVASFYLGHGVFEYLSLPSMFHI